MKNHIKIVLFIFILNCFGVTAQEKENKFFLTGYVKNLNEFSFIDKLNQLEYKALLHNRLNFKYTPSNEIKIRLEIRNRIFYGESVKNIVDFSDIISRDDGVLDASWNLINNGELLFNTSIDRFLINYIKGDWDVTLGRQRVNWGMNLVWNPNDIFNTYNILDFDYKQPIELLQAKEREYG